MDKKPIGIILIVIVIAAGIFIWQSERTSPESKVKDLEATKEDRMESSGYNACMAKVNEKMAKYDSCTGEQDAAIKAKLSAKGYADGLDCIQQFDNPICQNSDRYNAEIDASNESNEVYDECVSEAEKITNLGMLDCMKLLEE